MHYKGAKANGALVVHKGARANGALVVHKGACYFSPVERF
jgi:hypothetical protein